MNVLDSAVWQKNPIVGLKVGPVSNGVLDGIFEKKARPQGTTAGPTSVGGVESGSRPKIRYISFDQ